MMDVLRHGVREGFACVKLRKRSKAPVDPDWTSAPIPSFAKVRRWWASGFNVGVRLGKPSKLRDGHYLHVLDIDIRDRDDPESAFAEAAEKLRELFVGVNWKRFPTVQSGSGGKSRHVYFSTQEPFRSRKLARSEEVIEIDGKTTRRWEIELFGTGKQVAMPPSKHPSGKRYCWLVEPDWELGIPLIDSEQIEEVLGPDEEIERDPETKEPVDGIEEDEISEILEELSDLAYDREQWLRVGMALHHQLGPKKGWELFDWWSRKAPEKYDQKRNRIDWRSFKGNHSNPVTLRTILKEYRDRLTAKSHALALKEFEDLDAAQAEVIENERPTDQEYDDGPDHVLHIPGALEEMVRFYNENSLVEQPAFAVLAALGLGSIVLGRNVCTEMRNFSSIFMIGVGTTGAGKESIATAINHVLLETGLEALLGPEAFTSEGAILSRLSSMPKVVLTTDEFGKRLTEDRYSQNSLSRGAQRALISIFGKAHSVWIPTGYSTNGKTKEEAESILRKRVIRPALTIAAATTPSTFFEGISSKDLSSGLLNRFVIIEATRGLQEQRIFAPPMKVSARLKDWVEWASTLCANDDDSLALKNNPFTLVDPLVVPFSKKAKGVLVDIEHERVQRQKELAPLSLAEVFQRSREIAQRISLIVAVSEEYLEVQARHIEWAWKFVKFYHGKMATMFRANLDRSSLHQLAEKIAAKVKEAGEYGLSRSQLGRMFNKYQNLSTRDSDEVDRLLKRDYGITEEILRGGERGPKRPALVAPEYNLKIKKLRDKT